MHAIQHTEEKHATTVAHLSRASVKKHFDAYADVAWDDRAFRIDPERPALGAAASDEPLGATEWYRSQPSRSRARIGLELIAYRDEDRASSSRTSCRAGCSSSRALHERLARVPLRLPRADRGGAALADVPGVREPQRAATRQGCSPG